VLSCPRRSRRVRRAWLRTLAALPVEPADPGPCPFCTVCGLRTGDNARADGSGRGRPAAHAGEV